MTKEQLMQPRWKVIALWPFRCDYEIGWIIHEADNLEGATFFKTEVHKYPHLFRKLSWWEDRQESDMPEYVRGDDGQVFKIKDWGNFSAPYVFIDDNIHVGWWKKGCESIALYGGHIPATPEEYQQFKKLQDAEK